MQRICIFCALPYEIAPFVQALELKKPSHNKIIQCWEGDYAERHLIFIQSGVGKVHAAAAAQFAITAYAPDALISCGTAGSLDPRCHLGDIVVSERTAQHDYGMFTPDAFVPVGVMMRQAHETPDFFATFLADEYLLYTAKSLIGQWQEACQVFYGMIVSGDQMIFSAEKRRALAEQFQALAVDMESAAIAQLALLYQLPFLAVRSISDGIDDPIPVELSTLTLTASARRHSKTAAQHAARFALDLINSL